MRVALELVKEGRAYACVSAGNTGALMGLAKLLLKPIEGIERPALVTVLPHQQKGKPWCWISAPTSIATARCWCSSR